MHEIGTPLSYDVCFVALSIRVLPQFAIAQRQITTPTTVSRHLKQALGLNRLRAGRRNHLTFAPRYGGLYLFGILATHVAGMHGHRSPLTKFC